MIVLVVVLAVAIIALEFLHLRERRWWAERCFRLMPGGRAIVDKPRTLDPERESARRDHPTHTWEAAD